MKGLGHDEKEKKIKGEFGGRRRKERTLLRTQDLRLSRKPRRSETPSRKSPPRSVREKAFRIKIEKKKKGPRGTNVRLRKGKKKEYLAR